MSNPLDIFEIDIPREMRSYLRQNGFHFSKKANAEACKLLRRLNPATNKLEPIEPMDKETVEELLTKHSITLEHNKGYDFVYVANLAKAFYKKTLPDDKALAQYVKEVIDNPLLPSGNIFRRWLCDCDMREIPVEWEDIL